ncbi:ABC transporter substrate-binding protein [Geojedonia litorea]|uniref:ABC transporter substrate-binding protein n=1 Tax=Geojedonia litorea TaxID=1268269 RepID=A0ABV9N6F8_9FLAO
MGRCKLFFLVVFFGITQIIVSQNFSSLWEGYFSYYSIKDVTQGNNKIYAASENAIFSYDLSTSELQTITTINGLSGETITKIKYSETYQLLIIGYQNGLIEIVSESDNEVLSVVDILDKVTIAPNLKRINHFNEYNGLVYISTNYGISVYDLNRLEFGDTYFIGSGGSQITVNQTTVFNDMLYAACGNNNAIKKASLTNPNLIDYQQWQTIGNGAFLAIQTVEDRLYSLGSNSAFYEIVNDNLNQIFTYSELPLDVREFNSYLVITTRNNVFVYDDSFGLLATASVNSEFNTSFLAATITDNHIYIGTSSLGVLQSEFINPNTYQVIRPDGPLMNNGFKINAIYDKLWVAFGDYDIFQNPFPLRSYGLSIYKNEQWNNIPFDSLLAARNLTYISVNPFNPSQTFISATHDGLLKLDNDVATILYNDSNSGLEQLVIPSRPNETGIRVTGSKFDQSGLLWTVTSFIDKVLKSYDPVSGQWRSYSFKEIIPDPITDELGYNDLVIDRNGTKWIAAYSNGVVAYNENNGSKVINRVYTMDQNMPSTAVKSIAMDNRSQLWIGTIKGLRVLYNTSNFLDDPNPRVSEIVILDDGIPKELLSNQLITDIKVDGSNNKWVGTFDSGIFYFSPDGQQTIYHFTKDNSPLPTNTISDISIDSKSGKVYIATPKGLVSFLSGGSEAEEALSNAYVYPNPVRPEYNILGFNDLNNINNGVKIRGLTENVNIKITDIEGNLVAEAQSRINQRASRSNYNFAIDGGTAVWNGKNLANNIVASGVYLIMISDLDSFETKVLKLAIIR